MQILDFELVEVFILTSAVDLNHRLTISVWIGVL